MPFGIDGQPRAGRGHDLARQQQVADGEGRHERAGTAPADQPVHPVGDQRARRGLGARRPQPRQREPRAAGQARPALRPQPRHRPDLARQRRDDAGPAHLRARRYAQTAGAHGRDPRPRAPRPKRAPRRPQQATPASSPGRPLQRRARGRRSARLDRAPSHRLAPARAGTPRPSTRRHGRPSARQRAGNDDGRRIDTGVRLSVGTAMRGMANADPL
ncbi:hypothetical protein SAOR_02855 [Salinisphaera orenii MK-B5]|uniref:Uncharacterized protein n=1 Tax=Salinisphaera orenii MK-B5 TaxID=856730 RepID=A0A423PW15_9GAMM|nr:hypothetical protein SAOR_02855 [Salinisphaera orenii MK-B5]